MAIIRLSSCRAEAHDGYHSIIIDFSEPFPPKVVNVRTTADAVAALEAYRAEAAATGLAMYVSMSLRCGRTPNGFKAATRAHYVNC